MAQQLSMGGEHCVVAATYGDVPQCLGKMALAGAAGADDEHRDLLLQVAASGQIHYLRLVHSEVEGEVVAFEGLLRVDTGPSCRMTSLRCYRRAISSSMSRAKKSV